MEYNEDIFIIDCWTDTEDKEVALIDLIKTIKEFNIPILLSGHYPVKPEIQKMVDYYLFDKDNPILKFEDYDKYYVSSGMWVQQDNWKAEMKLPFHHDYAIWKTWKNTFNFANYLGKKYIHFLEYDNLPDITQYKQAFLERTRDYDAVIYDLYNNASTNPSINEYCATYIFSIKTEVGLRLTNKINSIAEYYTNKPKGFQLETVFLHELKSVTPSIFVSKYVANNSELNTKAIGNRDAVYRNGARFHAFLAADDIGDLYLQFMSGFQELPATEDYLVEVNYGNFNTFHAIPMRSRNNLKLGKYQKGQRVKIYYEGVEVFNEFLSSDFDYFRKLNKLTFLDKIKPEPDTINLHFVDGPFLEIFDKTGIVYHMEFIDNDTNTLVYSTDTVGTSYWAKASMKYYVNWKLRMTAPNYYFEHNFDLTNRRVFIEVDTKSLGDNIAFMPYIEEFRLKHNCETICTTYFNNIFEKEYPYIKFVPPGSFVDNLYAKYLLGLSYKNDDNGKRVVNRDRNKTEPKELPLQAIACDILGLEFKEIRPRIKLDKTIEKRKKRVCIAIHSTAQCKYWNRVLGWQDVSDYLTNNGYEVLLLSREENGYMGNYHPTGIKQQKPSPLDVIITKIQESRLFIGVSSGLSWLSWATNTPTMIISGFTSDDLEPHDNVIRISNKSVCNDCWSKFDFDAGDWNWCPRHKDTDRQFECSKLIEPAEVIEAIKKVLGTE